MTAPRAFVVDPTDPETVAAVAELHAHNAKGTIDEPAGAISAELAKKLDACAVRAAAARAAEAKVKRPAPHIEKPPAGTDELSRIRARHTRSESGAETGGGR